MKKVASGVVRFYDGIISGGAIFSGIILVFIMLAVFLDISLRFTIDHPLLWVVETSTFSLVAIAFFSAAWLLKREGHVSMDQIFSHLGTRTQAMITVVTSIVIAICCLIVVWYGIQVTTAYYQEGDRYYTMLEAPKWPISAIVVWGFLLLFIEFLRRISRNVRKLNQLNPKK